MVQSFQIISIGCFWALMKIFSDDLTLNEFLAFYFGMKRQTNLTFDFRFFSILNGGSLALHRY